MQLRVARFQSFLGAKVLHIDVHAPTHDAHSLHLEGQLFGFRPVFEIV